MAVETLVKTSEYYDSVTLMAVARDLTQLPGILDAAVVMGTEPNKSILAGAGMLTEKAKAATANDLIIAVSADSQAAAEAAIGAVDKLLKKTAAAEDTGEFRYKTVRSAAKANPDANVAVVSVAGRYATDEAWEALLNGMHVLLFSDNVSMEDEIALKKYAVENGLLLMGPGAGTTILNHVALGFANVIPAGPVGIVSAAGTGLQEVSTLLARQGVGITQGLGTGGRDLKKDVGGLMMLAALQSLQDDPETKVIALVSKPPAGAVVEKILAQVAKSSKPTVVCFMGGDLEAVASMPHMIPASTLQEGALLAAKAAGADLPEIKELVASESARLQSQAQALRTRLKPGQKFLRGLFSGGTLCYESQVIWEGMMKTPVYSNAPLPGGKQLEDSTKSFQHTIVDLGEEEFTVGRPHPMIDNDLRIRRLLQEARDPETAVILLDVVLGYGAHLDPAAELGPAVAQAKEIAAKEGRDLIVIASVTGTEQDPQCLSRTAAALERYGVVVCASNAAAARLTAMVVEG